jgi:hypothetical protein
VKAALWFLLAPVVAVLVIALLMTRPAAVVEVAGAELAIGASILGLAAAGRRRLLRQSQNEVPTPSDDTREGSSVRTTVVLLVFGTIVTVITFGGSRLGASTLAVAGTYYVALIALGACLGGWARTPPIAVSATLVILPMLLGIVQFERMYGQPHSPEGVLLAGAQIALRIGLLVVDGAVALGAWMLADAAVSGRSRWNAVPVVSMVLVVLSIPYGVDQLTRVRFEQSPDLKQPVPGAAVTLRNRREVAVPSDSKTFARSGSELLVVLPGDVRGEAGEGGIAVLRGNRLEGVRGAWRISVSGADLRSTLDGDDPFLVVPSGPELPGLEAARTVSLKALIAGRSDSEAIDLPTGLDASVVARAGGRVLAAGYVNSEDGLAGTVVRLLRDQGGRDLELHDLRGFKPTRVAAIEGFPDGGVNLAAAATADGIVHFLATEARISQRVPSSVRHLQFDCAALRWRPDQLLWASAADTQELAPRLVSTGPTLDAFWLAQALSDPVPTDGLYAKRIGEVDTWRLTAGRGEYAVLPDADGHGALLVGVATSPSENGRIRWFVRRGTSWLSAGETDIGTTVYTLTSGTEPFALWRDPEAGAIHAAFSANNSMLLFDVVLGDSAIAEDRTPPKR